VWDDVKTNHHKLNFPNLVHLELENIAKRSNTVAGILQHTPNVASLTIITNDLEISSQPAIATLLRSDPEDPLLCPALVSLTILRAPISLLNQLANERPPLQHISIHARDMGLPKKPDIGENEYLELKQEMEILRVKLKVNVVYEPCAEYYCPVYCDWEGVRDETPISMVPL